MDTLGRPTRPFIGEGPAPTDARSFGTSPRGNPGSSAATRDSTPPRPEDPEAALPLDLRDQCHWTCARQARMSELLEAGLVVVAAFTAATIAGVSGFGGAVLLLPVLVAAVGTRDAIVVLTVAQLAGDGSRVVFNRDEVDGAIVTRFAWGAIPAALAGGALFAVAPVDLLARVLGAFLIFSVVWRHVRRHPPRAPSRGAFAGIGALFGFLSALLGSVGPLLAPFFLAFGLTRGAYIGTEAACTIVMHTTKLVAYGAGGVLAATAALAGLALAPVMVAGSWTGKRVLDRLPDRVFVAVIEAVLLVSGALLLVRS